MLHNLYVIYIINLLFNCDNEIFRISVLTITCLIKKLTFKYKSFLFKIPLTIKLDFSYLNKSNMSNLCLEQSYYLNVIILQILVCIVYTVRVASLIEHFIDTFLWVISDETRYRDKLNSPRRIKMKYNCSIII